MVQLVVRDLDDDVKARLQRRAKQHGRSMEAEIRDILGNAVAEQAMPFPPLGSRVARRFRHIGLDTPIEELRGWDIRPPNIGE